MSIAFDLFIYFSPPFNHFTLDWLGESMAMSGIYGLRNSLSESNSSLSNSSINGSCIGTFAGTTSTGSSPDDSSLQLSASLTSNPFSHLTSVSMSSNGSLNTPIKNFDNLQVSHSYCHSGLSGHIQCLFLALGTSHLHSVSSIVCMCVSMCRHCFSIGKHFEG